MAMLYRLALFVERQKQHLDRFPLCHPTFSQALSGLVKSIRVRRVEDAVGVRHESGTNGVFLFLSFVTERI